MGFFSSNLSKSNEQDKTGSIATTLMKAVFSIYFFVAFLLTIIQMMAEYRQEEASVQRDIETYYKILHPSLSLAVWDADDLQINSILQGMLENPIVLGARLIDGNQIKLGQIGKTHEKLVSGANKGRETSYQLLHQPQMDLTGYQFPLYFRNEINQKVKIGSLIIFSSSAVILERVRESYILIIVNALLKTLALGLFFLYFSKKYLQRPIQKLTKSVSELTMDSLSHKDFNFKYTKKNELWVLSNAFQQMIQRLSIDRDKINDLNAQLKKYQENLTEQIVDKTVELTEANSQLQKEINHRIQAEEDLHSTLYSIGDGVVATDLELNIKLMSRSVSNLTGWSESEAIDRHLTRIMTLKSNSLQKKDAFNTILSEKRWGKKQEGTLIIKDESSLPIEWSISPILSEQQESKGYVLVFQDLSATKNLRQKLIHSQKLETIGTMSGGIAHEFNNVLNIMNGNIYLLERGFKYNKKQLLILGDIKESCDRAQKVVKQLFLFSHGEEVPAEPINICEAILQAVKLIKVLVPKEIHLDVVIEPSSIYVMATSTMLNQILVNLCSNSLHALMGHKDGEIRIHLEAEVLEDRKVAKLRVSDTGSGISEAHLDRIFDPFFSTKEVGHGAGMGMSIVHGMVHQVGGEIKVESQLGKGTLFTLSFPIVQSELKKVKSSSTSMDIKAEGSEKILLVDDEIKTLEVWSLILRSAGFQVDCSASPMDSMRKFQSEGIPYDLIITDYSMPKMNGVEFAKRAKQIDSQIPIILCTGNKNSLKSEETEGLELAEVLLKPYDEKQLFTIIRKTLLPGS